MTKKRKINFENGSISIYAIATVICFVIILSAVFVGSSSIRTNQLKTLIRIKEIYEASTAYLLEDIEDYVEDGLIAYYDGSDNTGSGHSSTATTWKDLSDNGNDGTLSTDLDSSTFYWDDDSLTLSGVSSTLGTYVETPINLNGSERTICYTVDATNLTGSIWADTSSSNIYGLINNYTFVANRGSSATSGDDNSYYYTFAQSGIYHYTITLSSTELKFYVNGVLTDTEDNTIGLTTSNNIRILADYSSNQNATNLKLYNFMVYNRALSESEVAHNYMVNRMKY